MVGNRGPTTVHKISIIISTIKRLMTIYLLKTVEIEIVDGLLVIYKLHAFENSKSRRLVGIFIVITS